MKKVIALHTSKRKMNTYKILVQIKEILSKNDVDVEIVSLYDLDIKDCIGCEQCILKNNCVLSDETEMLMKKISSSDGIIISSPVYLQQVSGKLKTFIDRTCKWFHRPELYTKPILCVATTKGSGLKSTLLYLESVAVQWGAMPAGSIGRNIRNINTPVADKELLKFIKLLNSPLEYRPPLGNLINFEVQKALAQHLLELDMEYWKEKDWNTKPYYFPCKINAFKQIFAYCVGATIRRGMKHNKH